MSAQLVARYEDMFKASIPTEALRGFGSSTISKLEKALETGVRDLQLENVASDVQFLPEDDD